MFWIQIYMVNSLKFQITLTKTHLTEIGKLQKVLLMETIVMLHLNKNSNSINVL